jgi:hypothetical protein
MPASMASLMGGGARVRGSMEPEGPEGLEYVQMLRCLRSSAEAAFGGGDQVFVGLCCFYRALFRDLLLFLGLFGRALLL